MHLTSHVDLLTRCPGESSTARIDAIVVPTHRPAGYLTAAVQLARELNCPLLALCSGDSTADGAVSLFEGVDGAAVTVSSTPRHALLRLRTQHPLSLLAQPYVDTGNKRNVGLLLGRLLGWHRILFLDDDIRALAAADVGGVAAAVVSRGLPVVGWRYQEFPDNSVVCHALRSSEHPQDVFIAAGALLVDLTGELPFFPSVYNEDWLFLHDFAVRGEVGLAGDVTQVSYQPFHDPRRATQEEFGDVLAEGLYALIHDGRSVLVGCLPGHWVGVIASRRDLLAGIQDRLRERRRRLTHTWNGYEIDSVLTSVAAASQALGQVTPDDLAYFTSQWRYDQYCWNARLHRLPRFQQISDALCWLGITDVHLSGRLVSEMAGGVDPLRPADCGSTSES
jgi:hypothetical protein